MYRQHLIKC